MEMDLLFLNKTTKGVFIVALAAPPGVGAGHDSSVVLCGPFFSDFLFILWYRPVFYGQHFVWTRLGPRSRGSSVGVPGA